MVTYIAAQYRYVVVCSGLYVVHSQSLHGGCIENAMNGDESSRMISHLRHAK